MVGESMRHGIRIGLRLVLAGWAILWMAVVPVHAELDEIVPEVTLQGSETLQFGETVTGTLDDSEYRRMYAFDGRAGDTVEIALSRQAGDLDPMLFLIDQHGVILSVSDDGGAGTDALIALQRLSEDGRYFVVATRFGQAHGSTSGQYSLRIDRIGSEGNDPGTVLRYGDNVRGAIDAANPRVFYFLRAERGDVINVLMRRTSGSLDPRLDLANTSGLILVSNDDDPLSEGTLDAAINHYLVLESGTYVVIATRFGDLAGDTEGTYSLAVSKVPPDMLGLSPEEALLADYGVAVESAISDEVYQRYFRFAARRGDVVTVTMTAQSGTLDPFVKILDANLTELIADQDDGEAHVARIAAFSLPVEGTYYVVATRDREQQGTTSGTFSLYLSGRPGIMGGRALEILYGTEVSGQINDQVVAEEYVFFGSQGDVVRIKMERASGDLDSLVTLLDNERKQIAFDDDSGGEKDALIDRFTLPRDGVYFLVASRYERETGLTQGAYLLTLDLLQAGN